MEDERKLPGWMAHGSSHALQAALKSHGVEGSTSVVPNACAVRQSGEGIGTDNAGQAAAALLARTSSTVPSIL